jgi:hypothetical protein
VNAKREWDNGIAAGGLKINIINALRLLYLVCPKYNHTLTQNNKQLKASCPVFVTVQKNKLFVLRYEQPLTSSCVLQMAFLMLSFTHSAMTRRSRTVF